MTCPALLLTLSLLTPAAQGEAPQGKALDALVAEYLALDGRDPKAHVRQAEIFAQLETVPALDAKAAKKWRGKLAKLWSKGETLEKKSGRHFLWEDGDEERGLYIVGGDSKRPKGLFIGMHGGGAGSGDAWSSHGSFSSAAAKMDWVAIFPQVLEKTEHGWTDSGTEEFVLELVERARRTWKIDPNRVYFGGHSMGGYGTWTLGAHHADVVAALTPSAGAPTPVLSAGKVVDIDYGVIPNLRNVPLVIYQSDDDPRVPPGPNRKAAELLAEARETYGGYEFEYWEVTGRGHAGPPGGMKALLEKVQNRVRDPLPDTVLWQPTLTWKRRFYWLWWERPARNAKVLARLDREAGHIRVECDAGAGGLHVLLNDELVPLDAELTVSLGDREVFRGVPERSLAVLVATGAAGDPHLTFDARVPLVP